MGIDRSNDEDFVQDCRQAGKEEAEERGLLPYWKRRRNRRPECRACGQRFDELTEDGLCEECDAEVKRLEEGKI